MRAFTFHVATHGDYGTLGLRPSWYPTGDPLGGMAAAHDILEHFANDDGSTEGELMALGASLFVRGDGGYSTQYRHYDCVRDPAGDIPTVWGYMLERENRTTVRACGASRDSFGMDTARAIIAEGMKEIENPWPNADTRERMACWIARGYARAMRRYSRVIGGACAVAATFMEIERQCARELKHAEEGMTLTVYVNVKRSSVRVVCDYPEDSYA
jgi:hypothetical protein